MTTWPVPAIAGFAVKAGIPTADIATVVALALAATGGKDHYHYSNPWDPTGDRWGLWGLPFSEAQVSAPTVLYDPSESAKCVRATERAEGTGYAWHESYGEAGHVLVLPYVNAVLRSVAPGAGTGVDGSFRDRLTAMVGQARAMSQRFGGP